MDEKSDKTTVHWVMLDMFLMTEATYLYNKSTLVVAF